MKLYMYQSLRFLGRSLSRLTLACIILNFCALARASDEAQKRVLVLFALRKEGPAHVVLERVFQETLRKGLDVRLDYYSEYIDVARFPEPEYQSALHDFLRAKYGRRNMDLIITTGSTTYDFAKLYGAALFPGTPVVFLGDANTPRITNSTGLSHNINMKGTLDLALRLQPGTRRVFVISGASGFDKFYEDVAHRQFQEFEGRLAFTYLTGLLLADLQQKVANMPEASIIYALTQSEDSAGNKFVPLEVVDKVSAVANAPIYSWVDTAMDHGIVGGRLLGMEKVAKQIAELGLRVLRGERPESIPVTEIDPTVNVVDWRQLRRWGIDESRLPPGTIIQHKMPSIWEMYKGRITLLISLFILEALLIGVLLAESRRRRRSNRALRASEANLRLLLETTAAVPWQADIKTGAYTYVGPQAANLLGYPLEQWYEKDFWISHLHPDDKEFAIRTYLNSSESDQNFEFGCRMIASSGETVWVHNIVKSEHREGKPALLSGFMLDVTQRKLAEESLQQLTVRLLNLQDDERRRIARELHDVTAQNLFAVNVNLARLQQRASALPDDLHHILDECSLLGQQALQEIRTLSYVLHPPLLDQAGLVSAVEWLVEGFIKRSGIHVALTIIGEIGRLPSKIETALFRIVQEALTNIHRHSDSGTASIKLEKADDAIILQIEDRGKGMMLKEVAARDGDFQSVGVGIAGMRQRLQQLGGRLEIKSNIEGTTVTAIVPLVGSNSYAGILTG